MYKQVDYYNKYWFASNVQFYYNVYCSPNLIFFSPWPAGVMIWVVGVFFFSHGFISSKSSITSKALWPLTPHALGLVEPKAHVCTFFMTFLRLVIHMLFTKKAASFKFSSFSNSTSHLSLSSFLRSSSFWGCHHFWNYLKFLRSTTYLRVIYAKNENKYHKLAIG